jgi:hypothetical protein
MSKERAKQQMQRAANFAVTQVEGRLLIQFSNRDARRCHHHSYADLARSVGLGSDPKTLDELKRWVLSKGLPEPTRPKPKNKK